MIESCFFDYQRFRVAAVDDIPSGTGPIFTATLRAMPYLFCKPDRGQEVPWVLEFIAFFGTFEHDICHSIVNALPWVFPDACQRV